MRCRARASGRAAAGPIDYPAFYSYAYPAPEGFAAAKVKPGAAFFSKELGEFFCPTTPCAPRATPTRR